MTSRIAPRALVVGGLPIGLFLALGAAAGCSGASPSDPGESVGPVTQDLRFPKWCGGFSDKKCNEHEVCLPFVARGCPGPRRIGLCVPRPHACYADHRHDDNDGDDDDAVCGCDGTTYSSVCDAAHAGASIEHRGKCAPSGQPVCGGAAGMACAGASTCVDDPSDSCTPRAGRSCPGICQCAASLPCARTEHFDTDPTVCACVPNGPDPCARITCPGGTMCVAQPDGSTTCDPIP